MLEGVRTIPVVRQASATLWSEAHCFAANAMVAFLYLKKALLPTHHPPNDLGPGLRQKTPSYRDTDLGQRTEAGMTKSLMDLVPALQRTISAAASGVLPLPNSLPCTWAHQCLILPFWHTAPTPRYFRIRVNPRSFPIWPWPPGLEWESA